MRIFAWVSCFVVIWLASPVSAAPEVSVRYDLNVKLMPEQHRMEVTGIMTLPPQAGGSSTLRLRLSNRMHDFTVSQTVAGEPPLPVALSSDPAEKGSSTTYTLALPREVPAGQAIALRIRYSGGEKPTFVFSMEGPTFYAAGGNTAWYPQYAGEARGTGRMSFDLPEGYVVAASGRAVPAAAGKQVFSVDVPTHLTFSAARYTVARREGTIPVAVYLLRPRAGIDSYVDRLQRVITGLAGEFGRYPYPSVALAEVPRPQANNTGFDGVSTEGLMLISDASFDEPFSLPFFAHELSHQWWGNLVTVRGDQGNYLLDEGLAQFGALRMVERLEGAKAAEGFRREGYPGYAEFQSAAGYFRMAAAGLDSPLDRLPEGGFTSHELADNKGFLVLNLLSRTVGRDRFSAALQELARGHAFSTLSWADFLATVQKHSATDLTWFYHQWFERIGAPELKSLWTQRAGKLLLTVTQTAPPYRLQVPVQVAGAGGKTRRLTVDLNEAEKRFSIPVGFRVRDVQLDPSYEILRWTPAFRTQAEALALVTKGYFLRSAGKAKEAQATYEEALRNAGLRDPWGVRFRSRRGLGVIAEGDNRWDDARAHYLAALSEPNPTERELPWTWQGLAVAAKKLKDDALLRRAVAGAIAADARLKIPTGAGIAAQRLLSE